MHPIDRYLMRIPRQEPDPDFVDKLFARIHVGEAKISGASNTFRLRERWRQRTYERTHQPEPEPAEVGAHAVPEILLRRASVRRPAVDVHRTRRPFYHFTVPSVLYCPIRKEALP